MSTHNHTFLSTYNLLRGLWGLISTVIIRVISTLNLQVESLSRTVGGGNIPIF